MQQSHLYKIVPVRLFPVDKKKINFIAVLSLNEDLHYLVTTGGNVRKNNEKKSWKSCFSGTVLDVTKTMFCGWFDLTSSMNEALFPASKSTVILVEARHYFSANNESIDQHIFIYHTLNSGVKSVGPKLPNGLDLNQYLDSKLEKDKVYKKIKNLENEILNLKQQLLIYQPSDTQMTSPKKTTTTPVIISLCDDLKRKRDDNDNDNNNNDRLKNNNNQPTTFNTTTSTTTTSTTSSSTTFIKPFSQDYNITKRFKSLIGMINIRQKIFGFVKELTNKLDGRRSICGRDIIKLPNIEMISKYAMPWDFIKHYIPTKKQVPLQQRGEVIYKYCLHPNASLYTLSQLFKWSPDYDPRQQYKGHYDHLAYEVACYGKTEVLTYLFREFPNIQETIGMCAYANKQAALDIVCKGGNLATVKVLLSNLNCRDITSDAMDRAARKGHLDVVKYLDKFFKENAEDDFEIDEECSTDAMNGAAKNGHINVVKYLNENRTEGCTSKAMDLAALNGHLNVVEYLGNHRTEGCTTDAMDLAALNGHLNVIQWLHENSDVGGTEKALQNAIKNGHKNIIDVFF
ncbi:hypothetical protein DFA_04147 [Cavenderia fasciculata]|uniref:Ankyrin repeat-containing protein n=1 Tax=Cavenderia fasciculata TaxID=261658 RepID=F4Q1F1_CACFS|nr:uncharacterized protein DFA_04147 [Cavenderia fasciculata]EGG18652.1 hypothetical protein DFA_04147 [Cavenderia fasciculata]|eukprot:XP_004366556.1 hypothetical protein DFA_04147 [Cavenderia fasciculata]